MKLTRYFFVVAVSTALATGLTGCLSQDEFLEEHSYKFDDQTFYLVIEFIRMLFQKFILA